MAEMVNLKTTARRQSTPGSLLVLAIALIVFGPKTWDTLVGEPWIDNAITVVESASGQTIVEDLTFTNVPVHGLRANTVESEDGSIICSVEHHNTWHGERKRFWHLTAFTGCAQPDATYRVCSRFSVNSDSGRSRWFGPFCSAFVNPLG